MSYQKKSATGATEHRDAFGRLLDRDPASLFSRRNFLRGAAATAAAVGLSPLAMQSKKLHAAENDDQRFLFVLAAPGGGNIVDSFLPILVNESPNGNVITAWSDLFVAQPEGSQFRCVHVPFAIDDGLGGKIEGYMPSFLERHADDVAVFTSEGTSVNHLVAQKRSLTGAGINAGRTIQEAMAIRHGANSILPNINMSEGGYLDPGDDASVPSIARGITVADALLFPFATDGVRGIKGAPSRELFDRARSVRNRLDDASNFGVTFRDAPLRKALMDARRGKVPNIESADLITKLMMVGNIPGAIPLDDFGLSSSPEGQRVRDAFPSMLNDPFEAQAALAFLLARYRVSCSMTLSPSFSPLLDEAGLRNAPLAFDVSHQIHTLGQYLMWNRMFRVMDGLIRLLKAQPFDDADPSKGTMWDRSLIYVATEFGREKNRPFDSLEYGTGHHLNNGHVIVSPLVKGNRVYGGVDKNTALTFGFDPVTGEPTPNVNMHEGDVYSALAHALDIKFTGRRDFPSFVK